MKTLVVKMSYCVVNLLRHLLKKVCLYSNLYLLSMGWGSLEATPFSACEQGSGEDLLTILGLCRNAGRANRITDALISRQCIKCETALINTLFTNTLCNTTSWWCVPSVNICTLVEKPLVTSIAWNPFIRTLCLTPPFFCSYIFCNAIHPIEAKFRHCVHDHQAYLLIITSQY